MAPSTGLSRDPWRTSSYSNNGGNCVEVATGDGMIAVRDTKRRAGTVLAFSPQAWQQFTGTVKG